MDQPRATRTVKVNKKEGLHARPAELFVKLANQYEATIEVIKNGQRADAKSMLHVLTLAAEYMAELTLVAVGKDADQAIEALVAFVENGFEVNGQVNQQPPD